MTRNEKIINRMPFAKFIAGSFKNHPQYIQDELHGESMIALIKAVDSYCPNQGASLDTWIEAKIRYALLDKLRALHKRINDHPAPPTPSPINYYSPIENRITALSLINMVDNQHHRNVLTRYYIHGKEMKKIGKELNITEGRVSQIIAKANEYIRKKLRLKK